MRSELFLQLLVLVALSFLAGRTSCYPRHALTSLAIADHRRDIGVPSVPEFKGVERAARSSLGRRSLGFHEFLDIGLGWNMYYSTWPSIVLPVQPAACALTTFYASLVVLARGKWAQLPPQHSISLSYGGISILMHCPQRPIPWLFVGNFAEQLLRITEGGWTGVYEVMMSQAETDVSIGVRLSVGG